MNVTKEQLTELILRLDKYGRDRDYYYGLPVFDNANMAEMREMIREWLDRIQPNDVKVVDTINS